MTDAFKLGAYTPLSGGHDKTVELHSSLWADDCHCQGYHLFCEHTLRDALIEYLKEEPE